MANLKFGTVGKRKEGRYFYTVYLAEKKDGQSVARELRKQYRSVRLKGGHGREHYAIWCRGIK